MDPIVNTCHQIIRQADEIWRVRNPVSHLISAPLTQRVALTSSDSKQSSHATAFDAIVTSQRRMPSAPILLEAGPGGGKSAALWCVARSFAERFIAGDSDTPLPVHVDLGRHEHGNTKLGLSDITTRHLERSYPIDYCSFSRAQSRVFLLDGLDLLLPSTSARSLVEGAFELAAHSSDRFVFASRPLDSIRHEFESHPEYSRIELGSLDPVARDRWLSAALKPESRASLESRSRAAGARLLDVPLLCVLAASTCLDEPLGPSVPARFEYPGTTGLLDMFVVRAVRRAIRENRLPEGTSPYEASAVLESVCFAAARRGYADRIPLRDLTDLLREVDGHVEAHTAPHSLWQHSRHVFQQCGILWPDADNTELLFLHQSFAEYFAGRHLARELVAAARTGSFQRVLSRTLARRDLDAITCHALARLSSLSIATDLFAQAFEYLAHASIEDACQLFAWVGAADAHSLVGPFAHHSDPRVATVAMQARALLNQDHALWRLLDWLRPIPKRLVALRASEYDAVFGCHAQLSRACGSCTPLYRFEGSPGHTRLLRQLATQPLVPSLIAAAMEHQDHQTRRWAIQVLADRRADCAVSQFEALAGDRASPVQADALAALAAIAPDRASAALRSRLEESDLLPLSGMWCRCSPEGRARMREHLLEIIMDERLDPHGRVLLAHEMARWDPMPNAGLTALKMLCTHSDTWATAAYYLCMLHRHYTCDWLVGTVRDLLPTLSERVARDWISSACRYDRGYHVVRELYRHASIPRPLRVHALTALVMGHIHVEKARRQAGLCSADVALPLRAAAALNGGRITQAIKEITGLYRDSTDLRLRLFYAALVRNLGAAIAADMLAELCDARVGPNEACVPLRAANLLAQDGGERGIEHLRRVMQHADSVLRCTAANCMRAVDPDAAGAVFDALLTDPNAPVAVREFCALMLEVVRYIPARVSLLTQARSSEHTYHFRSLCGRSATQIDMWAAMPVLVELCVEQNPYRDDVIACLGDIAARAPSGWSRVQEALNGAKLGHKVIYEVARYAGRRVFLGASESEGSQMSDAPEASTAQRELDKEDIMMAYLWEAARAKASTSLDKALAWARERGFSIGRSTLGSSKAWKTHVEVRYAERAEGRAQLQKTFEDPRADDDR